MFQVDSSETLKDLNGRVAKLELTVAEAYQKLYAFVGKLNKTEVEQVAVSAGMDRVRKRLDVLEHAT